MRRVREVGVGRKSCFRSELRVQVLGWPDFSGQTAGLHAFVFMVLGAGYVGIVILGM